MTARTGGNGGRVAGTAWRRLIATLALGTFLTATACGESPTGSQEGSAAAVAEEGELALGTGDLSNELGLTESQKEAIREVLESYRGRAAEAGIGWTIAAELRPIFTADQIASLAARLSAPPAGRDGHRARRFRHSGEEQSSASAEPSGADREARREAERAAMAAVLSLSAEQQAALAELHETMREGGPPTDAEEAEARRSRRIEALSSILDAGQMEIWIVHHAVVRHIALRGHRGGGPHRPDGGFGAPPISEG